MSSKDTLASLKAAAKSGQCGLALEHFKNIARGGQTPTLDEAAAAMSRCLRTPAEVKVRSGARRAGSAAKKGAKAAVRGAKHAKSRARSALHKLFAKKAK